MRGLAAAALVAAMLCAPPAMAVDDHAEFRNWSAMNPTGEFVNYLAYWRVLGVVPLRELVRTASDWERCGGPQFELPPKRLWPEVRQVLKLLAELKRLGIVEEFEAVSAYRNPKLNACAGGAPKSAHTRSFAIDIVPEPGKVDERRLCDFWRKYGRYWKMGLSKYPSGRIHIDTAGYRTWGATHGRGSAFCT